MLIYSDDENEIIYNQYDSQNDQQNHYPQQHEPKSASQIQNQPKQFMQKAQTISQIINPNSQKFSFKNFPKLLGNALVKKIQKKQKIPKGVQILIEKHLQDLCKTDQDSQKYFQSFVANEMFIHALNSNKIENPMLLIPAISNYWAAAQEQIK